MVIWNKILLIYTTHKLFKIYYFDKIDLWNVILFNIIIGCHNFNIDEDDINKEVLEKDIQF